MTEFFDRLLIDPSREALLAAVRMAAARDGPRSRFSETAPLLESTVGQSEGLRHASSGTAFLALAWWTDHQNRRHYRTRFGESRVALGPALAPEFDDPRPPLWHVYPDRVFRRTRGWGGAWLASCGCGATGLPAEVAWMGDCCGPCHDRREEGELGPAVSRADTLSFDRSQVRGLALDAKGELLAVGQSRSRPRASRPSQVFTQNLTNGQRIRLEPVTGVISALDFTPGGSRLAVGTDNGGVTIRATVVGGSVRSTLAFEVENIRQAFFSPDARLLAGVGSGDWLEVWEDRGGTWTQVLERADTRAAAFAPDGVTLAVGGRSVSLLSLREGSWHEQAFPVEVRVDTRVFFLGFDATGQHLVVVGSSFWEYDIGLTQPRRVWNIIPSGTVRRIVA